MKIKNFLYTLTVLLFTSSTSLANIKNSTNSMEKRIHSISKSLKSIPDGQWNEIASSQIENKYDIQKGDNLWSISQRLFGNPNYWPKIWSINSNFSNPHEITPGTALAFKPGSSQESASLDDSSSAPKIDLTASETKKFSGKHEYEKIDPMKWAPYSVSAETLNKYDEYGLEKNLKIEIQSRFNFRVPVIANDSKFESLAEIQSSRREAIGLSQGEIVFLKSQNQDLQVGSSYSILSEPSDLEDSRSDRKGFIYNLIGEIKVLAIRDEQYIGVLEKTYDIVKRGDRIYPLIPSISGINPVPAKSSLETLVMFDHKNSLVASSQYRFVLLDRGLEDGLEPGNIVRVYDYFDPLTNQKITESDSLVNADVLVVHSTAKFSSGMVIRAKDIVSFGDFGVALTDLSDLQKNSRKGKTLGEDSSKSLEDKELDELEELDRLHGDGLGKQEEQEIKELNLWDQEKNIPQDSQTSPNEVESAPSPKNADDALLDDVEGSTTPSAPEQPLNGNAPSELIDQSQPQNNEPALEPITTPPTTN